MKSSPKPLQNLQDARILCEQAFISTCSLYKNMYLAAEHMANAVVQCSPAGMLTKYMVEWYMVDFPALSRSQPSAK